MRLTLKKKSLFTCVLSLLSVLLFGQVELERHDDLNQEALRFWYSDSSKPSHKFSRNISPKGDCLQYANGYLFFSWYKGGMTNRNLMLSRLNVATNKWTTIQFPDKSSLYTGGEYKGGGDSHKTAAVGVSKIDGTVHLVYDMHSTELKYRFSQKGIAFAPDSEFTADKFSAKRNYLRPGEPITSFTYPNIEVSNEGELILEYRKGTSRQGDKFLIKYDGNQWSKATRVMQGDNEKPEFNQYGGFVYFFDRLYMGCAVRIKGDDTEFNQGFYFADAGQNGVDQNWKDINGNQHKLPIKGLDAMNKLRIAQPLPKGNNGMTSSPSFVVSKNGAVHFTNRVSGQGTVHYYSKPGSSKMIKAPSSSPNVSFPADDGRIYSIGLVGSKIRLQSTKEGEHNWRTDYNWGGKEKFDLMAFQYNQGKIHIVASEKKESDKLPLHYIVLKLKDIVVGPDAIGPKGYTYAANESETVKISDVPYDVAYGQDGQYEFLSEQTQDVICDTNAFGNDPASGVQKYCFIRESKAPYSGTPTSIPGIIEAENYDHGGAARSYMDSDTENNGDVNFRENNDVDIGVGANNTGYAIGWMREGEWLEYTIAVQQDGLYNFDFSAASESGTGVLGVDIDGNALLTGIEVPQTGGWDDYAFFTQTAQLTSGEHVLRLKVENGGFNLDKINISNNSLSTDGFTKKTLAIHPNPSKTGIFNLPSKMELKVYTISGKLVINEFSNQVDLSKFSKGIYILKSGDTFFKLIR